MSLTVLIIDSDNVSSEEREVIFIRENGQTLEITREEWDKRYPGREPLTVQVGGPTHTLFDANITHNLSIMANEAGIYKALWRPDELGVLKASGLIPRLRHGLAILQTSPDKFKKFNSSNGWGTYEALCSFVEDYLEACIRFPNAEIRISR